MRSCCKQVREFIDFGKHLHGAARALYDDLKEHAELTRVKMLLDFLIRHERHMEETLSRFEKETRSGILEAWLEYSPELDVDAVISACTLPAHPLTDDILHAALTFDDALVALYREVAEKANDRKTKAFFRDLLNLEEREQIQIARAAMSLQDM